MALLKLSHHYQKLQYTRIVQHQITIIYNIYLLNTLPNDKLNIELF